MLPGFPWWLSGKESASIATITGDVGLIPGLGISLEEDMITTPVFLPGEFHQQSRLVGYSPWGRKESGRD